MEKAVYLAPEIEVIEVAVEQGFAQSGSPEFGGFGNGGGYNQDWN